MSKWVPEELFAKFKSQVQEEAEKKKTFDNSLKWDTPERGSAERPNTYTIRLLPDKSGNFYKKMYYHMFQSGDSWKFSICPKTFDLEAFCPICAVTRELWKGSDADKQEAQRFKRKEKFITNIFVVNDPRDKDKDDDKKVSNTVKLYEFPSKVENLIRSSITDTETGVGVGAYDPSSGGFNFALKVGSTKKDAAGKEWPDYGTSSFSRNNSSVADSDEEIDEIINKTTDLIDYLKKQMSPQDKIIEILKQEMVFDIIKDEFNRINKISTPVIENKVLESSSSEEKHTDKIIQDESSTIQTSQENDSNSSDEDLLAELRNL